MPIHKKLLLILIIALILAVVLLGGIFIIFNRIVTAPVSGFQGPTSLPHAKGPTSPPPSYQ